jgi:hypothetical protein
MNFGDTFEEILLALNQHHVNYMMVGGYAVNFHGYERNTSDLDIWVKSSKENMDALISALSALNFDEDSLKHIQQFDLEKPFIFHIGSKPYEVEVFNCISAVVYEVAELHKITFKYSDTITVYLISIHDLILNKMVTGRTQDKLDIEMLQRIISK